MALLHILAESQTASNKYIVAHFNHGIRLNSHIAEELVRTKAGQLKLPFEVGYGYLGEGASEERARQARYKFLYSVREKFEADKIVTAHHGDDLVETVVINIVRGTGRRGMSPMARNKYVIRPLLNSSKKEILDYARANNVKWNEDLTNYSSKYLRNRLRAIINQEHVACYRDELVNYIQGVTKINNKLDSELAKISRYCLFQNKISGYEYTSLPVALGRELLATWFINNGLNNITRPKVEAADVFVRTAKPGSLMSLAKNLFLFNEMSGEFTELIQK